MSRDNICDGNTNLILPSFLTYHFIPKSAIFTRGFVHYSDRLTSLHPIVSAIFAIFPTFVYAEHVMEIHIDTTGFSRLPLYSKICKFYGWVCSLFHTDWLHCIHLVDLVDAMFCLSSDIFFPNTKTWHVDIPFLPSLAIYPESSLFRLFCLTQAAGDFQRITWDLCLLIVVTIYFSTAIELPLLISWNARQKIHIAYIIAPGGVRRYTQTLLLLHISTWVKEAL